MNVNCSVFLSLHVGKTMSWDFDGMDLQASAKDAYLFGLSVYNIINL